jgi:hypothetical protein
MAHNVMCEEGWTRKKFVRNFEGYNYVYYSAEKTVECHLSPVFPSGMTY